MTLLHNGGLLGLLVRLHISADSHYKVLTSGDADYSFALEIAGEFLTWSVLSEERLVN